MPRNTSCASSPLPETKVFLIAAEADLVVFGASDVGVTTDHLEGVSNVIEWHDGLKPNRSLPKAFSVGDVGPNVVCCPYPIVR